MVSNRYLYKYLTFVYIDQNNINKHCFLMSISETVYRYAYSLILNYIRYVQKIKTIFTIISQHIKKFNINA